MSTKIGIRTGLPAVLLYSLTLLAATGAAASWLNLGPKLPGRLNAVLTLPENQQYVMAGASGGGVWVSTPSTAGWVRPASNGLDDFHILHLAWDRIQQERIYASTPSDLYASVDFGDNWVNLTGTQTPAPLWPRQGGAEYKAFTQMVGPNGQVVLWSKACSGLYYSLDGRQFVQHFPFSGGTSNPRNCLSAVAADDATGRVYIALAEPNFGDRIYRTRCSWWETDPCTTWESMSEGLPQYGTVVELTWRGSADRVAAVIPKGSSTLIYTSDGGEAWRPTDGKLPDVAWAPRSLIAPSAHQLILGAVDGFQTIDNGETWSRLSHNEMHPDVRGIYWDQAHSKLWFATDGHVGQYDGGVLAYWDATPGKKATNGFVPATLGFATWQPYVTTVSGTDQPGYKRRFFSGSQDNGLRCSDNLGLNWSATGNGTGCGDVFALAIAPSDPDRGYARTCDEEVFGRTFNALSAAVCADVNWGTVRPRVQPAVHRATRLQSPALWTNASIAIHPKNPDVVAFTTGDKVSVSFDGGRIWSQSPSLGAGAVAVAFFPPAQFALATQLVAGTMGSGVFYSGDGGATWRPYGLNPTLGQSSPEIVFKVEVVAATQGPPTVYAATSEGLFRKVGTGNFVRIHGGPNRRISDVEADPNCAERLYVSHGYAGHRGLHGGGVDVSEDGGNTFRSLTTGHPIHHTAIPDIEIDPLESRFLYVATHGQGSWRYELEDLHGCVVELP